MIGPEGIYPYLRGGIVLPPGLPAPAITFSPGDASEGWNRGTQMGFPIPVGGLFGHPEISIPIGGQVGWTYESRSDAIRDAILILPFLDRYRSNRGE